MAVAAAVLAAVVAVWQRAQPAVAFDIVDLEGGVRVEVIDLITDPELATRQLEAAGLRATLTGVPVSEGLIGRVVAAGATGTATVAVTTDSTGVIVFDVVGLGSLNIEYGRRAIEGEESSGTNSVQCQAWRGQLIDDVRDDIERADRSCGRCRCSPHYWRLPSQLGRLGAVAPKVPAGSISRPSRASVAGALGPDPFESEGCLKAPSSHLNDVVFIRDPDIPVSATQRIQPEFSCP